MRDLESKNTFAVTLIGWLTLLFAVAYAVAGVSLLFVGVAVTRGVANEPPNGWEGLALIFAAAAGVLGVLALFQTVLGVLGGIGVLRRRRWGRSVTFVAASFSILWGLAFLGFVRNDALYYALGAAQIGYGIVAIVVLANAGAEFPARGPRRFDHGERVVASRAD